MYYLPLSWWTLPIGRTPLPAVGSLNSFLEFAFTLCPQDRLCVLPAGPGAWLASTSMPPSPWDPGQRPEGGGLKSLQRHLCTEQTQGRGLLPPGPERVQPSKEFLKVTESLCLRPRLCLPRSSSSPAFQLGKQAPTGKKWDLVKDTLSVPRLTYPSSDQSNSIGVLCPAPGLVSSSEACYRLHHLTDGEANLG